MVSARIGKGNLKVLSALLLIALILAVGSAALFQQPPQEASAGTDFPYCSWGCTANDLNITNVRLTDSTGAELDPCTPGDTAEAYIMAEIHNGAGKDRYAFWLIFDLYINGDKVGNVSECVAESIAGKASVDLQIYPDPTADPITWECGYEVQLKGLVLSWSTNEENCDLETKKCASRGTSQCYKSDEPLIVRAPLVADFDVDDHCYNTTVQFLDDTTGGAKPYDYSWDFGDGIGSSTTQNTSYHYTSPGIYP